MCKLCEEDEFGEMQVCQRCGRLICFDVKSGDDIIRPAYTTSSGDVFCNVCGVYHDADYDDQPEYIGDRDDEFDDEDEAVYE